MQTRSALILVLLVVALVVSACVDDSRTVTINPDGTGKIEFDMTFPVSDIGSSLMTGQDLTQTETDAKYIIQAFLRRSEGITAWRGIQYEVMETSMPPRIQVQGTAYFTDLARVRLVTHEESLIGKEYLSFQPTETGARLELKTSKRAPVSSATQQKPPIPAELVQQMSASLRERFFQRLKVLGPMVGKSTVKMKFHLPGTITGISGFTGAAGADEAEFALDMKAAVEAVAVLAGEEGRWESWIAEGRINQRLPVIPNEDVLTNLYGETAPFIDLALNDAPLFDYVAETSAAQESYPGMLKRLGLEMSDTPDASDFAHDGEPMRNVRISGMVMIRDGMITRENYEVKPTFQVRVLGELTGSVLFISRGRTLRAIDLDGNSLLSAVTSKRMIRNPMVSADGKTLLFHCEFPLPEKPIHGFREIFGELTYAIPGGIKRFLLKDLAPRAGVSAAATTAQLLDVGAKDKGEQTNDALTVLVEQVQTDKASSERQFITLRLLDVHNPILRQLALLRADGKAVASKIKTIRFDQNDMIVALAVTGGIPERFNLRVLLYDKLESRDIPWRIENVDLFGNPVRR